MACQDYAHTVQYYETDKMGITHHSNYVRWMEEARVDFLTRIGWDFDRLERMGLSSPVMSVECRYRAPTVFPEVIRIAVSVEELRPVRLRLRYVMTNGEGRTVCEGRSEHCFLNRAGKLVRLNRDFPGFYEALSACAETDGEAAADPGGR